MKILVIGNGFDLAHELPTRYIDFLHFAYEIKSAFISRVEINNYRVKKIKPLGLHPKVEEYILNLFFNHRQGNSTPLELELKELCKDNIWLEYFYKHCRCDQGWIDFEAEISRVVKVTDTIYRCLRDTNNFPLFEENTSKEIIVSLLEIYQINAQKDKLRFSECDAFVDRLDEDLTRLIRCLEIYLTDCVGKIEIVNALPEIVDNRFDKVLSFNYTQTFEKIYAQYKNYIEFDYIHGKADISNTKSTNNMVLGIDEYLPEIERSKEIKMIRFKKHFQRIYKATGCIYKNWVREIARNTKAQHEVYIYGHSLDITDKDILTELISSNNVKTAIYYCKKEVFAQQIANLVKMIGPDNLAAKVFGVDKKITFIQQKDSTQLTESELAVRNDILYLYNIAALSTKQAKVLLERVKKCITERNLQYFIRPANVLSIYDGLIMAGVKAETQTLIEIAKSLQEDCLGTAPIQFQIEEWVDFDDFGNNYIAPQTIKFIRMLNQALRKQYYSLMRAKLRVHIEDNDFKNTMHTLSLFNIRGGEHAEKAINIALDSFNSDDVEYINAWKYLKDIIYKCAPNDEVNKILINKLNNETDEIAKIRLNQLVGYYADCCEFHAKRNEYEDEDEDDMD